MTETASSTTCRYETHISNDFGDPVVLLWHGEEDVFSHAEHSRWLAKHIPAATIEVQPGAAHFGAVEILPKLLARMKAESQARPVVIDDPSAAAPDMELVSEGQRV